jgi:hypothetical protein
MSPLRRFRSFLTMSCRSAVLSVPLLSALLLPTVAAAADEPSAQPQAQTVEPVVETARRQVRTSAEWLARGVDSWFGDKPFSEGGKVSDGQLSVRVLKRQDEDKPDYGIRFNARFRLPNLEENAYVFIGRDDQREVVTDRPNTFSNEQLLLKGNADNRSFFAGLGLRMHDTVDLRLGFRGGLKPYAQARAGKSYWFGAANRLDLRETVFWTPGDTWGSTTALSLEHAFSSELAARWLNAATITRRLQKFEWSSSLGAYRYFGAQRLLSMEALASGLQGADVPVADYGLQLKWEQPVYEDWLIGELILGHFWPRPNALAERDRAWAVGGSLKMKF